MIIMNEYFKFNNIKTSANVHNIYLYKIKLFNKKH